MLNFSNITGGMHITMNGEHAWPSILAELQEPAPDFQTINSIYSSYIPELSAAPPGYNKEKDVLYTRVIQQLAKNINETKNQYEIEIISSIFKNWTLALIDNTHFLELCMHEVSSNSTQLQQFKLMLINNTLINSVLKGTLDRIKLDKLKDYISSLDLSLCTKIECLVYIYELFEVGSNNNRKLFCQNSNSIVIDMLILYKKLNLQDCNEVINYLIFNNDPQSVFAKALMLSSDINQIKTMLSISDLKIETTEVPSLEF